MSLPKAIICGVMDAAPMSASGFAPSALMPALSSGRPFVSLHALSAESSSAPMQTCRDLVTQRLNRVCAQDTACQLMRLPPFVHVTVIRADRSYVDAAPLLAKPVDCNNLTTTSKIRDPPQGLGSTSFANDTSS